MKQKKGYTEMKDSGVEWISQIPTDWQVKRLKEQFSFGKGLPITKADLVDSGVAVISYGQIHAKSNTGTHLAESLLRYVPKTFLETNPSAILRKGDIVLADTSEDLDGLGNAVLMDIDETVFAGYHTIILHPSKADFSKYLSYLFQTDNWRSQLRANASGIKVFSVTQKMLRSCNFILPPKSVRDAITAYLDTQCAKIDEIIAQAKASIEDYKQWKASIIYEAVTKGLDPNVEMKESGVEWIGKVPTHWQVTKIKNFVSIRSGITLGKQYPPGAQLVSCPYLRVANVKAEYVDLQDVATIMVTSEEAEKYALKFGELLMTEGGDRDKLGRGTIWHGEIPGCLHQNHVFAVQVNEKYMLTKFLDYLAASPVGREYFDLTAKKTTNLASTNSTTILQFSVPIPPLDEQEKIIAALDRNTATINKVIAEKGALVSDLESYKKSLIYEVVTGKRRVC